MAIEFLISHFFHLVFLAWGLGGATVAAILTMKAEKEPALMPNGITMLEPISKLIWVAIIGLTITGIVTTALGAGKGYYDATILQIKHVVVAVIVINGLNITLRLLPKTKKLAPAPGTKPTAEFLKTKRFLQTSSIVSMVLWYLVVALSVIL